jgi:primosomal protein N'
LTTLVANVFTEVKAINQPYSYLIPEHLHENLQVGDQVLVPLKGRTVKGFVVEIKQQQEFNIKLLPIKKFRGIGPPGKVVELCRWCAWRWVGSVFYFLKIASAEKLYTQKQKSGINSLNYKSFNITLGTQQNKIVNECLSTDKLIHTLRLRQPEFMRWLILAMFTRLQKSLIVLVPTKDELLRLYQELSQTGAPVKTFKNDWFEITQGNCIVVGNRDAIFAPVPENNLGAILIYDPSDSSYQDERAPTWHASKVARQRSQLENIPVVFIDPAPSFHELYDSKLITVSQTIERNTWAPVFVINATKEDPIKGEFPEIVLNKMRKASQLDQPIAVLVNRIKGAGNLFCKNCYQVLNCPNCDSLLLTDELRPPYDTAFCPTCDYHINSQICACGNPKIHLFNKSLNKVAFELKSILKTNVSLRSNKLKSDPEKFLVGTTAILNQEASLALVYLPYFDQILFAPKLNSFSKALHLLFTCSLRVLKAKGVGIILRTKFPEHPVIKAAQMGRPYLAQKCIDDQYKTFYVNDQASFAFVKGSTPQIESWIKQLKSSCSSLEILGPSKYSKYLIKAPDFKILCETLNAIEHPKDVKIYVEAEDLL